MRNLVFLLCFFSGAISHAQMPNIRPAGINGSAGAGFAEFTVVSPENNFELDQGVYVAVQAERGFDVLNLFLTFSIGYLKTAGLTNYRYAPLSGTPYSADDVKFDASMFQAGLGLKLKLIDGYWFRPYIEGGGVGGFYEIKYNGLTQKLAGQGTDFKAKDTLLDGGKYAEAGVEISFSDQFGIRAAARYIESQTRTFDTLDNQKIKYRSSVYYLCLLKHF